MEDLIIDKASPATRTIAAVKKSTMKALVYYAPGKKSWQEQPKPVIKETTDAVVKILKTTICGTDLHIMKGDMPEVASGRILGHEGVGIIEEVGSSVSNFKKGDHIVRYFVRQVFLLQKGDVFALRKWRLDTGLYDRWMPG